MRGVAAAAVIIAALLAGCTGAGGDGAAPGAALYPQGLHPYPDGDEWPSADGVPLEGPFALKEVIEVHVPSFDGVVMEGWIVLPDLPDGVRAPVVLWTAPYFGQCSFLSTDPNDFPACHYALGDDPALWDDDEISEAVPVDHLRENGYAVAIFNVRGTGNSGGCFEWFGRNEQRDQAVLVEWLAAQDWSNGHVAMMGLSYHGTTPWEAAIQNPPALKTIVVAGMVGDAYTFSATPQGAYFSTIPVFEANFGLRVTYSPPLHGPVEHYTIEHLPVVAERLCDEVYSTVALPSAELLTDNRHEAYWTDRRLIDDFPAVTAAVFLTHGFQDHHGSGHQQQENAVWNTLAKAPKRMLEGQWGHMMPKYSNIDPAFAVADWNDVVTEWFDFWLKGIGDAPPRLGVVDYQDSTGTWHASSAWPPPEGHDEVLYLTAAGLSNATGATGASFRAAFSVGGSAAVLCGGANYLPTDALQQTLLGAAGTIYLSEPFAEDALLAGNPIAYLQVEADLPGGLVAIHLYDVDGDVVCSGGTPDNARLLAAGAADLRFHAGNFVGQDFATGEPVPVRIDITNLAEVLPAGHRLAAVASFGNFLDRAGQPYTPTITLHGGDDPAASHLVLPFVTGGLGGAPPVVDYPPRPFVPIVPDAAP